MAWRCDICGREHDGVATAFGIDAPWRALVPESEFASRVELTADQCVVDEKTFFIRGLIQIPIRDWPETLDFSVWSSLSEKSFIHMTTRWESPEREFDPPYFGWLCSPISVYPSTLQLKLEVQSRALGLAPLLTLEPTDHPIARDQHDGITIARWHQIAHKILHG